MQNNLELLTTDTILLKYAWLAQEFSPFPWGMFLLTQEVLRNARINLCIATLAYGVLG